MLLYATRFYFITFTVIHIILLLLMSTLFAFVIMSVRLHHDYNSIHCCRMSFVFVKLYAFDLLYCNCAMTVECRHSFIFGSLYGAQVSLLSAVVRSNVLRSTVNLRNIFRNFYCEQAENRKSTSDHVLQCASSYCYVMTWTANCKYSHL